MHIIYHCFGGAHSSVTAASLHLGFLSEKETPTFDQLLSLPHYDQATKINHGRLYFFGTDSMGNNVYIIGRRGLREYFPRLIKSLAGILAIPEEELLVIDTIPCVNPIMMLGGYLSRGKGWVAIGRPLVLRGTQIAFPKLVNLVKRVKSINR